MTEIDKSVHSILAPSDSERWSRCVGAPYLSKGVHSPDAEYNASGSCSHWILEQCLKNPENTPETWLGQTLQFGINPATATPFEFKIDQERCDRIQLVINRIYKEPGQMWVEKLLNTSPVLGVPGQTGHADIIKLDTQGVVLIDEVPYVGVLTVHDFKDGFLLVSAKNNLQGLNYLAAALYELDLAAPINALRFVIHQPKIKHYDEWTYTRAEIEQFVTLIRPVAKLAYDLYHGNVEFDPKKHLNAGDAQCFWCNVRGKCPARAQRIIDLFAPLINQYEIDDATLSQLYANLDEVRQACKDYEMEASHRALAGRPIAGHKLVLGRAGDREWRDEAKAKDSLSLSVAPEKMFLPAKLVSPTQLEKAVGKKNYEPFKQLVYRSPAKLTLVPNSDRREAVEPLSFKPVEETK